MTTLPTDNTEAEVTTLETTETVAETTEVAVRAETAVAAPIGNRLAARLAKKAEAPAPVLDLINKALGEDENAIQSDEVMDKAIGILERTGLMSAFLTSIGQEAAGNIDEWKPAIIGLRVANTKAEEVQSLPPGTHYLHSTKSPMRKDEDVYFPVFIHGEELLQDDVTYKIDERISVPYNSQQEAKTPGFIYQNVVYLVNRSFTDVYTINVKSAGHKYVTNVLRSYMFRNYAKGMVFDQSILKNWMTLDVVLHKNQAGTRQNHYSKLSVDTEAPVAVSADEAKLIRIFQRSMFDQFTKVLEEAEATQADTQETQTLMEDATTVQEDGSNFTNL